jgi:hypothetical protein
MEGAMSPHNILRFEDSIRERPIRICGLFSNKGQKIFEKEENSSWQFPFSAEELQSMEKNILTYNDAMGALPSKLFSKDTIKIAIDTKLIELRVVTKSGTYSLKPISRSWPTFNKICECFKKNRLHLDHFSFEQDYKEIIAVENLDYHNDYSWNVQHYIWQQVAREMNLEYHRFH